MPTYDYQCQECNQRFETRHAMTYEGPVTCPECGSTDTRKLILETPGLYIHWWNARASSEATLPKYLDPVRSQVHHEEANCGKQD